MSHASEKTWPLMSQGVATRNNRLLGDVAILKEEFEQIKEVYSYCSNDDTQFANLLFHGDKDATTATTLQIAMAAELYDAAKVWDQLYDFMNNTAVTTVNRSKKLRNVTA